MTVVRWCAGLCALLVVIPSAPAADQAKINEAVAKGAEFLKNSYANGTATGAATGLVGRHGIGSWALSGLALLEAGIKPDDPSVKGITQAVRARILTESQTYQVALCVLYLDRLKDPADIALIQFGGIRLLAGMTSTAGWSYACGEAITADEAGRLQAAFQATPVPGAPADKPKAGKGADGFPAPSGKNPAPAEGGTARLHPALVPYYNAARNAPRGFGGDNSNTQFGMLGLWVAGRHGVPVTDAFTAVENRFLTTQNRDAGWSYTDGEGKSTVAMTCAGLLGLAFAQGKKLGPPKDEKPAVKGDPNDPFLNPKKRADEGKPGENAPGIQGKSKAAIESALNVLGQVVSTVGANALGSYVGHGNEYYLLWSVERVGMTYGLETMGKADWYDWGCSYILPSQKATGAWSGTRDYGEDVDTAFAILFLTRSNFARDLTSKITGKVQDKGVELRGGGDQKALLAPRSDPPNRNDGRPAGAPSGGTSNPTPPPAGGTTDPGNPNIPVPMGGGNALANALVAATGADWETKLTAAKDTKGSEYTTALVAAIPRLDAARQKQAREALAERLTRMTAATLRTMLKDKDAELRRGAVLACAMKEDKSHIPDLIDRITDESDLVVRAARAGLKSFTEKDFGPEAGATAEAKEKAAGLWRKWYESSGK